MNRSAQRKTDTHWSNAAGKDVRTKLVRPPANRGKAVKQAWRRSVFQKRGTAIGCVLTLLLGAAAAHGWGYFAHGIMASSAVGVLPDGMRGFFKANMRNLEAFAGEPDALTELDSATGVRHFIDLDAYSEAPFADVPADKKAFVEKFGEAALEKGTLPWAARDEYLALVAAFKARDYEEILRRAGHLAHYVSDASMPLHSTKNYKGQESGNVIFDTRNPDRHVHVRFEIGMIEANRADIAARVAGKVNAPHRVSDPADEALAIARVSYEFIGPILDADNELLKPGEAVTPEYFSGMYEKVGGLAVQQMALGATEVASFWYSAWLEAGSPSLVAAELVLSKPPLTIEEAWKMKEALAAEEAAK